MDTHKVNEKGTQGDQTATPAKPTASSKLRLLDRLGTAVRNIRDKLRSLIRSASPRTVVLVAAFVAGLLVFVLAQMRFFNILQLDDRVEAWSISYMRDYAAKDRVNSKDIKIIVISAAKQGNAPWGDISKEHREFFGKLVTAMKKAQAKVLAFDITFDGNSSFDTDFGKAIADAGKSGLKVVVGVDGYENGETVPEIPEKLREAVQNNWGLTDVGGSQGRAKPIRTLGLATCSSNSIADTEGERTVFPSFALRVLMETQDPPLKPFLIENERTLILRFGAGEAGILKSVPLEPRRGGEDQSEHRLVDLLIDQASEAELSSVRVDAQKAYDELEDEDALKNYKGRVVLVGYEHGESVPILSGGNRLGVELHATVISNILHNVFIFKLLPRYNFLVILLIALVVGLLHRLIGKRLEVPIRIPFTELIVQVPCGLLLFSAAYVVIAFLVYKETKVYLDVCYHITAVFLTYYLVRFALKKKFLSQT